MTRIPAPTALGALAVIALGAFAVALGVGSVSLGPVAVLHALVGDGDETPRAIVQSLRLPRALAGFATGGSLALAGALLQVLLRNPLADPYVMGVSGGAAVGALVAMLIGASPWMTPAGAFAGGFLSTIVVFGLARGAGAWSPTRLLLTGVIVASGWGAVVALLLSLAPETQLRGMLFWLMGDLGVVTTYWPALLALLVAVACTYPIARELNLLLGGHDAAQALGVNVRRLRLLTYMIASLATAIAVTTAGSIGFIGLIVPHALRLIVGNDQRVLLPACALGGGSLLVLSDTVARTIIAPEQLPVGVLTALVGVPAFLFLLLRSGSTAGARA